MPSSILYTDVGKVAASLAMQAPEILSLQATVGSTYITLNQNPPADWQVGSQLLLDVNNSALRETVTIIGSPNNNVVPISSTVNNHAEGAPVVNVTLLTPYISWASRWFDNVTNYSAGFAYESILDTKEAYITNKGYIVVPLNKPVVNLSDVTTATYQSNPMDNVDILNLNYARIRDGYFLEVVAPRNYYDKSGIATITYSGGYKTLPDDIVWAVTVMAARMYKERDSGYSDIIGSNDMGGIFSYKKAMPADVKVIVQNYKRWTE